MVPAPGNTMAHNVYNPPRPPEVYTLPDNVNEVLPPEIRENFQQDAVGRVLFFTAPPLDRSHKGMAPPSADLGHSIKYLAGRQQWLAERERKRKERDEEVTAAKSAKRKLGDEVRSQDAAHMLVPQAIGAMDKWFQRFDQDTEQWIQTAGLAGWRRPDAKYSAV